MGAIRKADIDRASLEMEERMSLRDLQSSLRELRENIRYLREEAAIIHMPTYLLMRAADRAATMAIARIMGAWTLGAPGS